MKNMLSFFFAFFVSMIFSQKFYGQFTGDSAYVYLLTQDHHYVNDISSPAVISDDNGGTYTIWRAGGKITAQHLDSLGNPYWTPYPKVLIPTDASNYRAIKWASGFLLAWSQSYHGIFNHVYEDSLVCMYFSEDGVPKWPSPVLITCIDTANGPINEFDLDLLLLTPDNSIISPRNDLTIISPLRSYWQATTSALADRGFTFNRIDTLGHLQYPLNSKVFHTLGDVGRLSDDKHGGFYSISIRNYNNIYDYFISHISASGIMTSPNEIPLFLNSSLVGLTYPICDNDTNAYLTFLWNSNLYIAKITTSCSLPWGNIFTKQIPISSSQPIQTQIPVFLNDSIYLPFHTRNNSGNDLKLQKLDLSGNSCWPYDEKTIAPLAYGMQTIKSGNDLLFTYFDTIGNLRGQLVYPDGSIVWSSNGLALSTIWVPSIFTLIPAENGDVTLIGSTQGTWTRELIGLKISHSGLLLNTDDLVRTSMLLFPNPATNSFSFRIKNTNEGKIRVQIYNASGQVMMEQTDEEIGEHEITICTENFPEGIYTVSLIGRNMNTTGRLCVVKN